MRKLLVAMNRNMAYNPATGANYAFTDLRTAAVPGVEHRSSQQFNIGESDYHALQLGFTKRMSNRWQGVGDVSATRGSGDLQNAPILPGCQYVTTLSASGGTGVRRAVTLAPDLAEEWYLTRRSAEAGDAQRHLGSAVRIAAERQVPVRRQRVDHADLRRRRAADRQQRRTPEGRRHADSAQQFRQAVHPQGGHPDAAAVRFGPRERGRASSRCSTCSTTRT